MEEHTLRKELLGYDAYMAQVKYLSSIISGKLRA